MFGRDGDCHVRADAVRLVVRHLDRQSGRALECFPVKPRRGRKCRQRLAIVPAVVRDVGMRDVDQQVDRGFDGTAFSCEIVLERPRRPGTVDFGDDENSQTTGRQYAADIGRDMRGV